jgi:dynein heavy chain, axonemal
MQEMDHKLSTAREAYRSVATRGALLYFFMDALPALDRVYWFSMGNFSRILIKGMDRAPYPPVYEDFDEATKSLKHVAARVTLLVDAITTKIFQYLAQGMFERDKPVAAASLAFSVLQQTGRLPVSKLDALLKASTSTHKPESPPEWLPSTAWSKVVSMSLRLPDEFEKLPEDIKTSKRWKEWWATAHAEDEPLPGDWRRSLPLDKLLLVRALRPDRFRPALAAYVDTTLGASCHMRGFDIERSLEDAGPCIPILVFISPGVDAAVAIEALAHKKGLLSAGRFVTVSLGQGQEASAMAHLRTAAECGGWVLLQNIHLTMDWTCTELIQAIDNLETSEPHPNFQLFLSAEPPPSLERPLPPSLLQSCLKLTNEPPQGLRANMARAWALFDEDSLDACSRQTEYRAIIFGLCFFHAAMQERKKYGVGNLPGTRSGIGWNMAYPFGPGDLRCCAQLAANYLDASVGKIPWEDLQYVVGQIMYGGHVVEAWDRRLVEAYLSSLLCPSLLEKGIVAPGLMLPPSSASHAEVAQYIERHVPVDGAVMLGLHVNAEESVAVRATEEMCAALSLLQALNGSAENHPVSTSTESTSASASGAMTVGERGKHAMDAVLEILPSLISLVDVRAAALTASESASTANGAPYAMVLLQECERMNDLLMEIRSGLAELDLGLKGDLAMNGRMEDLLFSLSGTKSIRLLQQIHTHGPVLSTSLPQFDFMLCTVKSNPPPRFSFSAAKCPPSSLPIPRFRHNAAGDRVPESWSSLAAPSLRPLNSWMRDLAARHAQLTEWAASPTTLPSCLWLSGLFAPATFLTAVQQVAARKAGWALDATSIAFEVTRRRFEEIDAPPREGAYVHGLWLEGASWDERKACLEESRHAEMVVSMPVLHVRAVPADQATQTGDVYACPVYVTRARFRQEVCAVPLRGGRGAAAKWAAAGVALILDAE